MKFIWEIDKTYGVLEIIPRNYDAEYFHKYEEYAKTPMGARLTEGRINFVDRWHSGKLLDVGIGCGQFLTARVDTYGYDINPVAVEMLKKIGKYADWKDSVFPAYSFFDSFEHIKDHAPLLDSMPPNTLIFMSIPIFRDVRHIFDSKHFRPDEHYWYFTAQGLIKHMVDYGFCCLDVDNFEIRAGREDIWSFVFKRRG